MSIFTNGCPFCVPVKNYLASQLTRRGRARWLNECQRILAMVEGQSPAGFTAGGPSALLGGSFAFAGSFLGAQQLYEFNGALT